LIALIGLLLLIFMKRKPPPPPRYPRKLSEWSHRRAEQVSWHSC
jgi:hypothetical protein